MKLQTVEIESAHQFQVRNGKDFKFRTNVITCFQVLANYEQFYSTDFGIELSHSHYL